MRYQIASKLSEHLAETPEGYLLCLDVPIARTGVQEYAPDEVPFEPDTRGLVLIERHPDEVFAPETIASFEGKPVTIDHPDDDVTPASWRELAGGHAQNVRRGAGAQSDLLLADLLITDEEAIRLVRGGLREISCGYDADYEPGESGKWMQRNIRGNHIALVRRGRCGPRCMINDNHEDSMKRPTFKDRLAALKQSFGKLLDEAAAESSEERPDKKPEEGKAGAAADDATEERLAALEAKQEELTIILRQLVEAEKAEGAEDEDPNAETDDEDPDADVATDEEGAKKTGDGAAKSRAAARDARTVDTDTRNRAKILNPRMRIQDGDKRCAVQRAALRHAMGDQALAKVIGATLRGGTLDSCDCVTLDAAFVAASEVARVANNGKTADALGKAKGSVQDFGKPTSPADINRANAEAHAKRKV